MPSHLATGIELLHLVPQCALVPPFRQVARLPFRQRASFVPDEHHRPVLLVSRLAEHSRNLQQDPRASLMVARSLGNGELARATLVGEIAPCPAPSGWVERYLRYQPDARRLLALGDFGFVRLEPRRIQVIGGFARAGWIEGGALREAAHLGLDQEARLLETLAPGLPEGWTLLGVDAYGADLDCSGRRERVSYRPGPVLAEAVAEACARALQRRLASPGDDRTAGET